MSTKLLVSTSKALLAVDLQTQDTKLISEGYGLYYGIARLGDSIFVAARNLLQWPRRFFPDKRLERPCLLEFDAGLNLVRQIPIPVPARGLHQIIEHRGVIYCTCSAEDSVVMFNGKNWCCWYPSDNSEHYGIDKHHFNSLKIEDDVLYLLAHNNGASEILSYDLATKSFLEKVQMGKCAHNILRLNGELVTCSSAEGTLVNTNGIICSTEGFPRGFAELEEHYVVGISAIAQRKRRMQGESKLEIYSKVDWQLQKKINLGGYGQVTELFIYS
ncbi:MAG: hypothetical protein GJ680_05140 [Alteromonadaceae bacterium]|nr:hypothetical protein [Alteromonadaceae bacterium]